MPPSIEESRFDENEREFLGLTLARQIFGALYSAVLYRRESHGMTRADFGERTGRDKTGVSKLLKGPANWTIQTISDVANALELDTEIVFIDRHDHSTVFTSTGMVTRPYMARGYVYMTGSTPASWMPTMQPMAVTSSPVFTTTGGGTTVANGASPQATIFMSVIETSTIQNMTTPSGSQGDNFVSPFERRAG